MAKDSFQSYQVTQQGLVLHGKHGSMTIGFAELASIIEGLSQETTRPQREDIGVAGWSGSRPRSWLDFVRQEQPHADLH